MTRSLKRLSTWLIVALFFCVGMLFVACDDDPVENQSDPVPSAEQGDYYYAADAGDYDLSLVLGNTFTLSIEGKNLSGSYTKDGELLTLSAEGGSTYTANYYNDVVTLSYNNSSYRFLRKINYTVKFDTAGGSSVSDLAVMNGKTAQKPADPSKTGTTFVGWYTDSDYKSQFSFAQPITANLTLYARFVENIDPEFPVSFDANHLGADPIDAQTTVGHKLFSLPTPEWQGHTFIGWWYSDYGTADRLTAQYQEQLIEEPITLYAVWDEMKDFELAVSVTESGINWRGRTGNNNYTVSVTDPDNVAIVSESTVATSYDVDFSNEKEGDYVVKITLNGKTTTAYYKNKALAHVTDFKVEGNTLLFNSVSHATHYYLTVNCGTAEHTTTHSHTDLDLGTKTSYDFSLCDMTTDGITFTVRAAADGYVESQSEPFNFKKTLSAVTGLTVDTNSDTAKWNAVSDASSYVVTVFLDGGEVFNKNIGSATEFDLQYYNKGQISVFVAPVAFGWISPAAAQYNYTKARLATPENLHLTGSTTIAWDDVEGASSYQVVFDGKTYPASSNQFDLAQYYDKSKSEFVCTVQALGSSSAQNSLATPDFTIRNGEMGDIKYEGGYVTWNAVFGYDTFLVKVGEGEQQEVSAANSYKVTFTEAGETTISVAIKSNTPDWKTVKVMVYSIEFDTDGGEGTFAPLFKAKGDPIEEEELPKPGYYGYTFGGWFSQKGGLGNPFEGPAFEDEYNRTVYAKWNANQYKISFNVGLYGAAIVETITVSFGSDFKLPVPEILPRYEMYAFAGWFDSTNARYTDFTGKSTSDYLVAHDVTLIASWAPVLSISEDSETKLLVASKGEGINYVTEVKIPYIWNGRLIQQVGDFSNSPYLEKINIPDTISSILLGTNGLCFQNCPKLTQINIYDTQSEYKADQVYYSVDGVLFYWNANADNGRMELKYYPYGRQDTEYTIPATITTVDGQVCGVSTIAQGAFRSYSTYTGSCPMTVINIPSTVRLIEQTAFYNFRNLTTINFLPVQEGVPEAEELNIVASAFGDPNESTSVAYISNITLPRRLNKNPKEAFEKLTWLAYVSIEEGGMFSSIDGLLVQKDDTYSGYRLIYYPNYRRVDENGNAYIPENATSGSRASEFIVPKGITAIGEEAVKNVSSLKKIVIPAEVRYIGKGAFEGTTGLTELIFKGDKDDLGLTIDERAFLGERWNSSYSSSYPQSYTTGLLELTLPANLEKLGANAFGSMTGLTTSSNLNVVNVTTAGRESVEYAAGAFEGIYRKASYLATVNLGPEVPALEVTDIFGTNLKEVNIAEGNPNYYRDEDGIVYDSEQTKLVFFPTDWNKPYKIPATITNVPSGMFSGRTGLTEITFHKDVVRIGDEAFKGCTGLVSVTFTENATGEVKGTADLDVGASAFQDCKLLTTVELPERTKSIGSNAFANCTSLIEFTIPKNVESLGMNATYGNLAVFTGCTSLKEFKIAEGNTHYQFIDSVLYSLREVKLTKDADKTTLVPDSVIYIPDGAEGVIKISPYIHSVGPLAFSRSGYNDHTELKFTKVIFADAVETFDPATGESQGTKIEFNYNSNNSNQSPFSRLPSLTEIRFPAGMEVMPDYLVYNCTGLKTVNVPKTVTSIQSRAFYSTNNITTFTFDEGGTEGLRIEDAYVTKSSGSAPELYTSLFGTMKDLTTITFPARLTYLGSHAFYTTSGEHGEKQYSYVEHIKFAEDTKTLELGTKAFRYTKNLRSIEFPKQGLSSIPDNAFYYTGLTSIEIPACVTSIGQSAFSYSSLAQVTFNKGLTSIGNSAFASSKLTSLTLPEGLKTIGNSAFNTGTLAGELVIPASVTSIGTSAFTNAKFTKVTTVQDNLLESIGASAFSSNTALTQFVFGETETPLTFGNTVFAGCSGLTSFAFPANVKEIGASAFANLTHLTEVTFAEETGLLEKIGDLAFSKTGLTSLTIPESSAQKGIELGANLFKSCTAFTTLNLSASVSSIEGALSGCASITTIEIDKGNPYFESDETLPIIYAKENGARGAVKLVYGELTGSNTTFRIADGGTSIGASAFANQTSLEVVYIPASVRSIGDYAFQNCINLKRVVLMPGSTLGSIGKGAFMNCWKLESINLEQATHLSTFGDGNFGSSVSAAYNGVFMYAGIKSASPLKIKLPASVEKLGTYMFANSGAAEIDLSACTKVTAIPTGGSSSPIFYGFFSGNKNLTRVKLPSSIVYIGTAAFADCPLLGTQDNGVFDISNLTKLEYFGTSAGTAPGTSSYSLYTFANDTGLKKLVFPSSVKSAGGRMFVGCSNLETIEGLEDTAFPAGYGFAGAGIKSATVSAVSTYMFMDCPNLENVSFGTITDFKNIDHMFQNCTGLKKIDLSALTGLASLGSYVFDGCSNLEEVILPTGTTLTHLGVRTFQDCTSLKRINSSRDGTIDLSSLQGLVRFSSSATTKVTTGTDCYLFAGCTSINEVILPTTLLQIGGYAFQNCTGLTKINLENVTDFGRYSFANSGLTSVTIPASASKVFEGAFSNCVDLKDVIFADGTGTVALTAGSSSKPGVFGGSGVQNVTFSKRITTLTMATFMNCPDLTTIKLPATLTGTLGSYLFAGCTNLKSADLSDLKVKSLADYMFEGCTNLQDVKLSKSLNYLGKYTFRNCTSLTNIDISETQVDRFMTSATGNATSTTSVYLFAGCTNLQEVKTREGQIKQIGSYVFRDCENLTKFDFSGIQRLAPYAFYNTGLTGTVTLPKSLTWFCMSGDITPFYGCGKIEAFAIEGDSLLVNTASSKMAMLNMQSGCLCLLDLSTNDTSVVAAPYGAAVQDGFTLDLSALKPLDTNGGLKLLTYLLLNATNIKKVILPDDMTDLPAYLFQGSSVEEVVLPANLKSIGKYAFADSALKKIDIPASVTSVEENAFAGTAQLVTVNFLDPEEGTEAEALTFAAGSTGASGTKGVFYASGIANLVLPDRLTDVPAGTFKDTTGLQSVTFPKDVTKINNYMFYGSTMSSLQLTDSITEIGNYVYSHVKGLSDLTAEDFKNVTTIGTNAFEYTEGIKNVTFSDTAVSLGNYMFAYSKVQNVVFPGTVTTLGNYMFQNCDELDHVEIKSTADGVERDIKMSGTFRYSSVKSVEIGEGVTEVGSGTFLDCTSVASVKLPESLKSIGNQAFENCPSLTELVIYDNIESIGCGSGMTTRGAFADWTKDQTIYFTASRSYISSLVGLDWAANAAYQLEANIVFDYEPEA